MSNSPIRVAVTGAAGQIGYSLLFRIASGAMFGPNQPVILHLIEIPDEKALKALGGVIMELDDCAFPLLKGCVPTSDLNEGFRGVNWSLLVGAVPRKAGMERKDLLGINGKIFTGQGQAIARNAAKDVRTLVVGNPCNTNCLIAMSNAAGVPKEQFFAMTMLDENRAKTQLAKKASVDVTAVSNLAIWGNHSSTMFPDFFNAKINNRPVVDVIGHREWLEKDFIATVQKRGAAIIEARGLSSAASAANAVVDTVRKLTTPTPAGDWFSVAVHGDGSYGLALAEEMRRRECERLEKQVPPGATLILLDELGEQMNSPGLATFIGKQRDTGTGELVFAIGGAYGFSDEFRRRGRLLSLSKMTFTHQMVRVFLLEQIYRAFTILNNEPYHH